MENYSNLDSPSLRVQQVLNSRINSHGLVSAVTYLPQSDSDIVTLACWAMNAIGRQSLPCLVHILPARKYTNISTYTLFQYKLFWTFIKTTKFAAYLCFPRRAGASTSL